MDSKDIESLLKTGKPADQTQKPSISIEEAISEAAAAEEAEEEGVTLGSGNREMISLQIERNALVEILQDIAVKQTEIAELIAKFYEVIGEDAESTVANKKQVKKLLEKYSQLF